MSNFWKWSALGGAAIAAAAVLAFLYIYLASEAQIMQRFTLPSSILHVETSPESIARGNHLATIFGCKDCHGGDLRGRMLWPRRGFSIFATNLRAFAKTASDEDFDRAVRRGLTPDARAVWVMPTESYVYMTNDDLADIIAYIRSLPPDNAAITEPQFGLGARLAIIRCKLQPASPYTLGLDTPLDVGPRWGGGRYLAMTSCSQCHLPDLTGDEKNPDLSVATNYSRSAFFHLMHGGNEKNGKLTEMSAVAGARFGAMHDYETDALYDYLVERARVLKTSPPPPQAEVPITQTVCPPAHKKLPN
ncbi:MAG TPA: hypothetical protein VGT78_07685 [Rhizomicrobium sp.]|nr:hypothetical protein [Rhizomicrobium sp.]